MTAMGRGDDVGRPQWPARADGGRFLSDREVHEAGDFAVAIKGRDALFEATDHQHPAVHFKKVAGRHEACSVLTGTNPEGLRRQMTEEIEIPGSFPRGADVSGKRVVITGAGRGLGRLLAHAFSHGGASVALVARTETDLKTVAAEIPGASFVYAGDVTDPDFNESVADGVLSEWGGLDVWICNAGISPILAGPREIDPAVWRDVLDVNLTGAFLGARAAARVMRPGGRLIFTGSVLGERPRAGLSAYSASKAGLVGLAKALALDLAPDGITVNVVAPGWFDSPLAESWKASPKLSAEVLAHTAQGRWGAATDLAGAYQFLASDASAFVTGTVLNVDGGYLLV
jgi:NAD(P)-dependent dehydrogenase (short-subunit alcohol dehydrogenase family)